jgi:DNA-binding response OmpR family regulator
MQDDGLILIVDDNEMNRDMLARRLARLDYQTLAAENGERAIALMKQQSFALVLLDIMMPHMNGYEVLQYIKADPLLAATPVIMITAVDDLDSVVKCIEMGAEDYLFKPFNPVLLKARISATIEKTRARPDQGELRSALQAIRDDAFALSESAQDQAQFEAAQRILWNVNRLLGGGTDSGGTDTGAWADAVS